jgi:hypothetical protein
MRHVLAAEQDAPASGASSPVIRLISGLAGAVRPDHGVQLARPHVGVIVGNAQPRNSCEVLDAQDRSTTAILAAAPTAESPPREHRDQTSSGPKITFQCSVNPESHSLGRRPPR